MGLSFKRCRKALYRARHKSYRGLPGEPIEVPFSEPVDPNDDAFRWTHTEADFVIGEEVT